MRPAAPPYGSPSSPPPPSWPRPKGPGYAPQMPPVVNGGLDAGTLLVGGVAVAVVGALGAA